VYEFREKATVSIHTTTSLASTLFTTEAPGKKFAW
jgi:hypothetical protein